MPTPPLHLEREREGESFHLLAARRRDQRIVYMMGIDEVRAVLQLQDILIIIIIVLVVKLH